MKHTRQPGIGTLFHATSRQSVREVIESISAKAPEFGFIVRHVFDMRKEYIEHHVNVSDGFDLCQIMVCNMQGSYSSMSRNMERAAVIFQPKQITVFSAGGVTSVNYFPLNERCIADALPKDEQFHKGLSQACLKIVDMIKAAV